MGAAVLACDAKRACAVLQAMQHRLERATALPAPSALLLLPLLRFLTE
ncbi:hypothetical protein [Paenibacillus chungangensis]|uniref:Uncharacterized protein n=1 Tax=Paenibacillus chungangensis TaxID=696535 RepID=A0ABW3HSD4_9BACL